MGFDRGDEEEAELEVELFGAEEVETGALEGLVKFVLPEPEPGVVEAALLSRLISV